MDKREQKRKERVERIRNWFNIDNIIDASVDLFLILFDVLSSPILIVMRLARWVIGEYLLGGSKKQNKESSTLDGRQTYYNKNFSMASYNMCRSNNSNIYVALRNSVWRVCNGRMGRSSIKLR